MNLDVFTPKYFIYNTCNVSPGGKRGPGPGQTDGVQRQSSEGFDGGYCHALQEQRRHWPQGIMTIY